MATISHQTIKLGRGKHSSPQHGSCVMELASMLAGEPFSDHPKSVSPVIASFLRAYNDVVDNERRQDLYECAAIVVGTTGPPETEAARAARLAEWTAQRRECGRIRRLVPGRLRRFGLGRVPAVEATGTLAARSIRRHTDRSHAEVLALVDELITLGSCAAASSKAVTTPESEIPGHDAGERETGFGGRDSASARA